MDMQKLKTNFGLFFGAIGGLFILIMLFFVYLYQDITRFIREDKETQ